MSATRRRIRILSVAQFRQRFGTAEQCSAHLARVRWPAGFVCPACGCGRATFIATRGLHQCADCRRQTSITAGTIFHKSRVGLDKWFWALYRLAQDKKGCSAMLLSKELDVSYPTAWLMGHKIRQAMAQGSLRRMLQGVVELDDTYLGGKRSGRRGRGASGKTPLLVAVEVGAKGKAGQAVLAAVRHLRKPRVTQFVEASVAPEATIRTDQLPIYRHLGALAYEHEGSKVGSHGDTATRLFPTVHTVISNLKRFVLGRHHATEGKHASRYLGEFTYRFNHRWWEANLFETLIDLCARSQVITYPQLKAAELH
jgi:transposase-like protein